MKKFFNVGVILGVVLACGVLQADEKKPDKDEAKPVNAYCAVMKDHEVDPKVTTVYQEKVIGFCCDECIPKFEKDPEKYMKDLK